MNNQKLKKEISRWMTEDGNNFCALPFTHLAIEADGNLLPCCQGSVLMESDNTPVNIKNYDNIAELINHKSRSSMANTFKQNKMFPNCKKCWQDRSEFSPRVKFSTNKHILQQTKLLIDKIKSGDEPSQKISWLEIKLGNKCNLKCRICGPINSSSWAKDDFNLKNENTDNLYKNSPQFDFNKNCLWINDLKYYNDINELEDLNTIHIMGGEPLLVPEHFSLLENLAKNTETSKITIWYNTNATYFLNDKQKDILSKFKKVQWSLSVDDVGARFEYQRKNANWDKTKKTINSFFDLAAKNNNHKVVMDPTLSIYNILHTQEIIKTYEENNWVYYPFSHFVKTGINSIRSLNIEQKNIICKSIPKGHTYERIIPFINSANLWSKFIEEHRNKTIFSLDKLRNESFKNTFSKMNSILNIYS